MTQKKEKQDIIEHFHQQAKSMLRMCEYVGCFCEYVGCLQEEVVSVFLCWTSVLCNPIEVKKGTYGNS